MAKKRVEKGIEEFLGNLDWRSDTELGYIHITIYKIEIIIFDQSFSCSLVRENGSFLSLINRILMK